MNYRRLGKTDFSISEVSLGTWQVGGKWGSGFDDGNAERILNEAIDRGINFVDTADVYEDGKSEAAVGRVVRSRSERIYTATKCGRKISPHINEGYTPERLRGFVEDSLRNTGLDTLDLIQLHCPPTEVYYRPEIFEEFDRLKDEGKIRNLGVSVEKVEEGLKAIEYPNVATVQIIFNMLRRRPSDLFFDRAVSKDVGIIVRVPLASGLLSGKFDKNTSFASGDHRNFNRDGSAFDRGETFAGMDFETGIDIVEEVKKIIAESAGELASPEQSSATEAASLAQHALRWILTFPQVSTTIPGASKLEQLESNIKASDTRPLPEEALNKLQKLYDDKVKPIVHHRW
ncbi:MAG: aldo/keto reductase [Spirochaetia bacterium]